MVRIISFLGPFSSGRHEKSIGNTFINTYQKQERAVYWGPKVLARKRESKTVGWVGLYNSKTEPRWTKEDLRKLAGKNLIRVFEAVETISRRKILNIDYRNRKI